MASEKVSFIQSSNFSSNRVKNYPIHVNDIGKKNTNSKLKINTAEREKKIERNISSGESTFATNEQAAAGTIVRQVVTSSFFETRSRASSRWKRMKCARNEFPKNRLVSSDYHPLHFFPSKNKKKRKKKRRWEGIQDRNRALDNQIVVSVMADPPQNNYAMRSSHIQS